MRFIPVEEPTSRLLLREKVLERSKERIDRGTTDNPLDRQVIPVEDYIFPKLNVSDLLE